MKISQTIISGLLGFGAILLSAFGEFENHQTESHFRTVKIGNQEWMAENLNTATFRNGDLIPEARTRAEWQLATINRQPVWCHYGNDPANGEKYGKLYNWYAVVDPRGLAPEGWHIPADDEWTQLIEFLGGEKVAGAKLKSKVCWAENSSGTNESRFSAHPGGALADDGYRGSIGYLGVWWSSTADTSFYYDQTAYAWYRYLYFSKNEIIRYAHSKGNGFSVRCLRD
jgi:uncharacterized protein (TIGR02145 family)